MILLAGCSSSEEHHLNSLFTVLSSDDTGVNFINENVEDATHNILKYEYFYNGGGVGLADINNDGLVDIYLTSNQGENRLYLNKGGLKFEDITIKAGVPAKAGWKTGVSMVDINADGFIDIYVSRSGNGSPSSRENILYINNKDLTFTDQAAVYGLNDNSFTTQTSFFDYDLDGDLDAFVLNHSRLTISNSFDIAQRNSNQRVPYVGNRLYRNEGGKFVDVSEASGIYGPASNYGLGIATADINNDGWPDLYISNDYTGKDKLLLNNEGREFIEVSDSLLTHMSQFSMGVDVADVNNDGLDDIFSLDMLPETNKRQKELLWPNKYDVYAAMAKNGLHHQYMRNMLHINNGDGTFSETAQLSGISNTDWSWSALIADYDLDGLQDIFISNGFKREFINNDFLKYKADLLIKVRRGQKFNKIEDIIKKMPSNKVHNYMFKNRDGVSFDDVSTTWGFEISNLTNGAAYADLDNDGDLDLVINQLDDAATIYRNNALGNYLKVRLRGSDKNSYGIGSKVTLYFNGNVIDRTLNPVRGFQSSVEPLLSFGLDTARLVDSAIVRWPRGGIEVIRNIKANRMMEVNQNNVTGYQAEKASPVMFEEFKNPIPFRHHENDFVDFRVQALLPRSYSTCGPAVAYGDVNNDGLKDYFIGGAKGQSGAIFVQTPGGNYIEKSQPDFIKNDQSENIDAALFDMDADGDLDLYVVNGGFEFVPGDPLLSDRLYENDGNGNFRSHPLTELNDSGACVRPCDVDQDGDLDLFIGNRILPGRYPEAVESYMLINDGKGSFTRGDVVISALVTDATWMNINNDEYPDLVLVGEWMPVTVMLNRKGKLVDSSSQFVNDSTAGWWNKILSADFDLDGDIDLVIGNFGNNNQYRVSPSTPMVIDYGDFDRNGSVDPIISYYIGEGLYPSATRDELLEQLPSFRKRFNNYASYANTPTKGLINAKEFESVKTLKAYTLTSCYFRNDNGKLSMMPLPASAQVAPIFALGAMDVNRDGNLDILTGGNLNKMGARFGKATGNFGNILLGDGHGNFNPLSPVKSGIAIRGEVRSIISSNISIIYFRNNDAPMAYRLNNR
ncbi:MAG: VCBS repeat-containing protein [Chryseolinea sp.]